MQTNKLSEINILNLIEEIGKTAEANDDYLIICDMLAGKYLAKPINELAERLDINSTSAVIFSVVMYLQIQESHKTSVKALAEYINYPIVEFYKMYDCFEVLRRKGYLETETRHCDERWKVRKRIFKQIIRLENPEKEDTSKTIFSLCQYIYRSIEDTRFGGVPADFIYDLRKELEEHEELKEIVQLKTMGLHFEDQIIFFYAAYLNVIEDRSANLNLAGEVIFRNINSLMFFKKKIMSGSSKLLVKKLIKPEMNEFMGRESYVMGDMGLKVMQMDKSQQIQKEFKTDIGSVIIPEEVNKVELFYNEREGLEINNLKKILRESNYKKCIKKLKERNLPEGISVLLYGFPGTGKTELVHQLARLTGRKMLMVDLSSIKDKFVGESEKRVAKVFEEYKRLNKMEKKTPILLFNESDALLNKRINIKGSVDQMNNAMQNVFLQKLEEFNGIVMATSNLIGNLDKAFERRFLIKLKIDKPNTKNRSKILKKRFPELERKYSIELAENYLMTGAQIENVSRRFTMDKLFNDEIAVSRVEELIKQELMKSPMTNNKKLGFRA